MRDHGKPKGRNRRPNRTVPPHVINERQAWEDYKARTTPEQRARHSALLHGADPDAGPSALRRVMAKQLPLFDTRFAGLYAGGICCFCEGGLPDDPVATFDGRYRCRHVRCVRAEREAQERAA